MCGYSENIRLKDEVVKLLAEKFHAFVAEIMGKNQQEGCFLMKDVNITLMGFYECIFSTASLASSSITAPAPHLLIFSK